MPKTILCPTWKRLVAFVIDFFLVDFLLLYPFTGIAENAFSSMDYSVIIMQGPMLSLILAVSIIYILYFLLFEWLLGQTIGKMLMRIVSATIQEKQMSFWQALGRNLMFIPVVPFVFLWVIDPIFIIWRRVSFSEMLTKTKTIEVPKWTAR
jgi:uncharacterized RDD family membrane protein YckC